MNEKPRTFVCGLRRQHHLLWLLLGIGFSLYLCSKLVQRGAASLGLMIGLLVTYCCAGRLTARLVAHSAFRSATSRPAAALFASSAKVGGLFSILSILFHLLLLVLPGGPVSSDLPPQMRGPVLLRAAIFPFLACLGAACTVSSTAPTQATRMLHYPQNSELTTLTD